MHSHLTHVHAQELFLDLLEVYHRYKGRRNLLVGHSFGSSQVKRLAAHVEAAEAAEARALARQQRHEQQHQQAPGRPPPGASEILGLVLLASAYHVPDGGNPIFQLPLPVLSFIKPVISQVRRFINIEGGMFWSWTLDTQTPPRRHITLYLRVFLEEPGGGRVR